MKVHKHVYNGKERWLVEGRINGKRKRKFFDTKAHAEEWRKLQQKDTSISVWWLDLSNSERIDIMSAFNRAKEDGFSLLSAVESHAVQGRGKTHLKKCTLGEAVGNAYIDVSPKLDRRGVWHRGRPKNEIKPSGFLGVKFRKGVSRQTLFTLKSVVHNFRDFIGADVAVTHISPEMVESWLDSGASREMEAGEIRPRRDTTARSRTCSTG